MKTIGIILLIIVLICIFNISSTKNNKSSKTKELYNCGFNEFYDNITYWCELARKSPSFRGYIDFFPEQNERVYHFIDFSDKITTRIIHLNRDYNKCYDFYLNEKRKAMDEGLLHKASIL